VVLQVAAPRPAARRSRADASKNRASVLWLEPRHRPARVVQPRMLSRFAIVGPPPWLPTP
jgi:hypothetical protein